MSQFKAGDLALIINAKHPENIGKVVELLRNDNSEIIWHDPFAPGCTSNPLGISCWLIKSSNMASSRVASGDTLKVSIGALPEGWLMPLRGDFTPETERETELTQ